MSDIVKPEVIKKTQDLLGKVFTKPPLTAKLLKKPPFRFLHDIISAVIKKSGYLNGLFSEEELNSENVKDKNAKIKFLHKLIYVVEKSTNTHLGVKPNKIIAGLEPTKTNLLLQLIGKAVKEKVNSDEAVAAWFAHSETSKEKHLSRSSKSDNKSQISQDSKKKSENNENNKIKQIENLDNSTSRFATGNNPNTQEEISKIKLLGPVESERRVSNEDNKTSPSNNSFTTSDKNEDSLMLSKAVIEKNPMKDQKGAFEAVEDYVSDNKIGTNSSVHEVKNTTQMKTKSYDDLTDVTSVKEMHETTNSSANFTTSNARPGSARPAAPKLSIKLDVPTQNNKHFRDNHTLIISETSQKEYTNELSDLPDDTQHNSQQILENNTLNEDQGHLVAQIIKTQNSLGTVDNNFRIIQDNTKTDLQMKSANELLTKEIYDLIYSIQNLTRASNPLGKLTDYVQENIELMQKEYFMWKNQNSSLMKSLDVKRMLSGKSIAEMTQLYNDNQKFVINEINQIWQMKKQQKKNFNKIKKLINQYNAN